MLNIYTVRDNAAYLLRDTDTKVILLGDPSHHGKLMLSIMDKIGVGQGKLDFEEAYGDQLKKQLKYIRKCIGDAQAVAFSCYCDGTQDSYREFAARFVASVSDGKYIGEVTASGIERSKKG